MVLSVIADPKAKVPAAIIMLLQSKPLLIASLKSNKGLPSKVNKHKILAPSIGGKAVPCLAKNLLTPGKIPLIKSGTTHITITKKKIAKTDFSYLSIGVTVFSRASKSKLAILDISGRSTNLKSKIRAMKQIKPTGMAKDIYEP